MRKHILPVLLICVFMAAGAELTALAEIMTCTFSSAIPRSGLHVYNGTALRMNRILDNPLNDDRKPGTNVTGGVFGLKVIPKLEVDIWVYGGTSTAFKVQGKVLCWQKGQNYLSVAPGFVSSEGRKAYDEYNDEPYQLEKCSATGLEIPVLYTWDTERNLFLNLSGGLSYEWVKVSGTQRVYNPATYQYDVTNYDYPAEGTLQSKIGASLEANYKIMSIIPELGLVFFKDGEVTKNIVNWGMSIGFRW